MNATTSSTSSTTSAAAAAGRDWRQAAACGRVDPEIFYPIDPDPNGPATAAARRVCAGCPVQPVCLADVMATEDPMRRWGITAGLTAQERTDLYASRRRAVGRRGAVAA